MFPVESTMDLSRLFYEDDGAPDVIVESDLSDEEASVDVSSDEYLSRDSASLPPETFPAQNSAFAPSRRPPLQWTFKGLTVWLELEEFDSDVTRLLRDLSSYHGTPTIPQSHTTAIYGIEHLSANEAAKRLRSFAESLAPTGGWPTFRCPVGVVQDVAVAGNPGQVCSIAWAQLTLSTGPDHESAMDRLYDVFYGVGAREGQERHRPWTPHNSVAYDNPKDTVLNLSDTLMHIMRYPTLLGRERRAEYIALWSTEGKMEDWKCIDRVKLI